MLTRIAVAKHLDPDESHPPFVEYTNVGLPVMARVIAENPGRLRPTDAR
jgi:hypothetical protein